MALSSIKRETQPQLPLSLGIMVRTPLLTFHPLTLSRAVECMTDCGPSAVLITDRNSRLMHLFDDPQWYSLAAGETRLENVRRIDPIRLNSLCLIGVLLVALCFITLHHIAMYS